VTGLPFATYPLAPPLSAEALTFLQALMTRAGTPAPGYQPEVYGWLNAYHCTRCTNCGAGVVVGSRCRGCGGPR
jgi:hypothetical protein